MKLGIKCISQRRRASLAVIPILFGISTLIWALWFFGYEQTFTKRTSTIENAQNIQAIIFQRAAALAVEVKQKKEKEGLDEKSAKQAGDQAGEDLYNDLMARNKISY